jgi:hypothetical protein
MRVPARILRTHENKATAEVHDYLDERTGVLAAMEFLCLVRVLRVSRQ